MLLQNMSCSPDHAAQLAEDLILALTLLDCLVHKVDLDVVEVALL